AREGGGVASLVRHWLQRANVRRRQTNRRTLAKRLTKRSTLHRAYTIRQSGEDLSSTFPLRSANWPRLACPPSPSGRGLLLRCCEVMTSDNSLSLILRRLDEIERKLDRILEELRTPTAIGYSVRRGNLPRKD